MARSKPYSALRSALVVMRRNSEFRLLWLAVLVGGLAAYGAVAFRLSVDALTWLFFGVYEEEMPIAAAAMAAWHLMLITSIGGLAIGLMCKFLLPGPLPQGVADVMEANALRNGRMPLKQALAAAWLSIFSISIGGSTGREGPIVHLCAALASQVVQFMRLSPSIARTLLGCAVASGVAAAFNAPIAGVFFALEVVVGHYGIGAFAPVVIASLIGTIVTRVHIGGEPAFALGAQHVQSFWEVPAFLILGLVSGLVAILLMRGIALVRQLHEKGSIPDWLQPAIGGVALGGIALIEPDVLGIGYAATSQALNNQSTLEFLLILGAAKAVATMICLGSRFGGGIFSPSLALGAVVGGAFGLIAAGVLPSLGSEASVYAVVGMAALAASTLGAPISTIIMIFELTTDYGVTFAIMAAVAMASLITRTLYGPSFFHWQLRQRGVDIDGGRELALMRDRRVSGVMRADHVTLPSETSLNEIKTCFKTYHQPIFVTDESGKFMGTIEFEDLADAAFDQTTEKDPVAREIARHVPIILTPEDDLARAFAQCQKQQIDHIPVVRCHESREIVGEVRYADLIRAYNEALLRARAIEHGRE